MRWEVEVALSPPDLSDKARPEYERLVERVAGRLAAVGLDEVVHSSDELDAGLADIEAQRQRAGSPTEFGWMTTHRLAFVLTAVAVAPAYRPVLAQVRAAALAERHRGSLGRRGRRPPAGLRVAPADALMRA